VVSPRPADSWQANLVHYFVFGLHPKGTALTRGRHDGAFVEGARGPDAATSLALFVITPEEGLLRAIEVVPGDDGTDWQARPLFP
jgi:hypothetical protein